jgi:hypothetical protein
VRSRGGRCAADTNSETRRGNKRCEKWWLAEPDAKAHGMEAKGAGPGAERVVTACYCAACSMRRALLLQATCSSVTEARQETNDDQDH